MTSEEILNKYNSVAVVGFSQNHNRPSNRIGRYLLENGFKVFGVNPGLANKNIDGIQCFESLKSIESEFEIVNVFRRSEFLLNLVNEILLLKSRPAVVWTQFGVIDTEAKNLSLKNSVYYIENKCIMTEHQKLILKNS